MASVKPQPRHSTRDFKAHRRAKLKALADNLLSHFAALEGNAPSTLREVDQDGRRQTEEMSVIVQDVEEVTEEQR